MAWHRASSDRSSRSSSPNSSTPLSPSTLPQWLLPSKATVAVMPPGRFKLLFLASICMILGWSLTTSLSSQTKGYVHTDIDNTYAASTGVLGDPTGFGPDVLSNKTLISSDEAYATQEPTTPIKDALGSLHKAVTDKWQSWKGHTTSHESTTSKPSTAAVEKPTISAYTNESIHDGQSDTERLGARVRIGKCTILFNGNDLWERAIRTHEVHDKMHGYRLHVLRQHLLDDVWSKPAYILSLILRELAKPESDRLEWLFWVDADTILLNPYIPIETFLPPAGSEFEHIHLLYSNDWNGLNNGVFPIRVNKWSVELLSAIVAFRYYRPDDDLTFRDQSAMNTIMKEPKFAKNIMEAPQRWFNAYQGEHNETLAPYQIRRGDLLVHFAGVGNRNERMAFWLDRAEQHMDDWEVPYKSTSYPEEVRDFWAQQRSDRAGKKMEISSARMTATELQTKVGKLLEDFGDRLSVEQLENIKAKQAQMSEFLGEEKNSEDLEGLNIRKAQLEASIEPLEAAKKDGHKSLLTQAHDAIFGAEKELLVAGFYDGVTNPEAVEVDSMIKQVKELILSTEDTWDRAKIITTVDGLTNARSRLKDKLAELDITAKKLAEQQKAESLQSTDTESVSVSESSM